ncbi:Retinoblastoma- protein 1 [Ancistrocladus abbreviatus]
MEDSMASTPNVEGGDETEARFVDLCKRNVLVQNQLLLDQKSLSEALKLLKESKHILLTSMSAIGCNAPEELERYWFSFILFSVKRLSNGIEDDTSQDIDQNGLTLCKILRAVKLNLVDFFKELPHFVVKVGTILSKMYGADWEKRLEAKELQTNFVHLRLLSKYYKRAYQVFFKTSEADKNSMDPNSSSSGYISEYHKFGWLLFLALRVHAFGRFKDLVTCTNGLVSILAILIVHVPSCFRNFTIPESPLFVKKNEKGVDLLASLCAKYDTSKDEVKKMMEKANNIIVDILKKRPSLASECKSENLHNIDPDGLIYFEDLLEDSSLSSSISMLENDYDDVIWNKGDIDERLFGNEDDTLLGSGSLSGGAVNINGAKRKFDVVVSPTKTITSPISPHESPASHSNSIRGFVNTKMAATPVSTAMTTAKWLRTIISPLPSTPSAELQRFLSSCDRDESKDVVHRAHIILEAIFPNSALGECCTVGSIPNANLMDNIWSQQRRMEALKLYYKVLEAICTAESQLLHANNLTSLLTNERFHRCMLACSAELVLATHKTVTMLFPAVLEKTGITAFDLSKVIESFIRHEDSLPRELRRHLNSLEERLLESMVWEKGSSLYNSLMIARPALSMEINRLGLLAEPMPSLDTIATHMNISSGSLPPLPAVQKHETSAGQNGDIRSPKRLCTEYRSVLVERNSFTSPVKDRLSGFNNLKPKLIPPALQSAFASPTRPSPGGGGETCAETGVNIFFSKIVKLAAVRINGMVERLQLSQQLRESVYCLFQQILNQRTPLFFNRHIDQIILCCFYGVAKISQLNLTFKEIIYNYRKQPQCKPQVFRSVFVDWSSARHNPVNQRAGQDHVDIITFYNEIFIPAAKALLVELGPAVTTAKTTNQTTEVDHNNEAQCPGSPKVSLFPSLPDMSPKKVSSIHNVYVSPLRSSKMDALISHSSKSYYACVGESTHAYQSPSKDLTVINDRLNSVRKIRGPLNFDGVDPGLVSDSIVANSLYPQKGSCASSPVVHVKSEQPDS